MITKKKRFRSLSEIECYPQSKTDIRIPLFDKESAAFCFEKSRELLSKPFNLDLNLSPTNNSTTTEKSMKKKNLSIGSNSNNLNSNNNNNNSNNDCDHIVVGNLSKKARDFIGENLIDIENTLKALNLDFLQTFNELEKTDSAETLFGETYGYDSGMKNPKIRTSSIKLSSAKLCASGGGGGGVDINTASPPKSAGRSIQCSPLAGSFTNAMTQFYSDTADADKRSSTPDTGFASRETNASSSRRGSQKSSYSPQDNHYSPREFGYSIQDTRSYLHELTKNNRNVVSSSPIKMTTTMTSANSGGGGKSQQNNTPPRKLDIIEAMIEYPNRQRSMSFTENYELKSPILSETQQSHAHKYGSSGSHIANSKSCNNQQSASAAVSYKPKSIRARNLRRLSYNPVVLDSSSSSSSETEFDRSIAHSECDIRSSMLVTRRRRQYLNRKSSVSTIGQDKLYGSNASIKSAPQYNYDRNDRQVKSYLHQKFNYNYNCDVDDGNIDIAGAIMYPFDVGGGGGGNVSGVAQQQKLYRGETVTGSGGNIIHTTQPQQQPPPPPRGFDLEPLQSFNRNILYSEFDVSKLTGKSPTTQSFLQELFPEPIKSKSVNIVAQSTPSSTNNASVVASKPNVFQWPEKIHASAVKQNDMLWRQHHAKAAAAAAAAAASVGQSYSSDSSSTETDAVDFGVDFSGQRMPPSPAP